jgi:hypothetical protein
MRRHTAHPAVLAALPPCLLAVLSAAVATPAHAEGTGDIRIARISVNGGSPVVIGPHTAVPYAVRVRITDDSRGRRVTDFDTYNATTGRGYADELSRACKVVDKSTSICTVRVSIDPVGLAGYDSSSANANAGRWTTYTRVAAHDGDYYIDNPSRLRYSVLRQTRTSITPSARTVARGTSMRFSGSLTRADWEHGDWDAYGNMRVQLRFKRSGATSFTTLKTVTTSKTGDLSAKVTASSSGTYRWRFLGDRRDGLSVSSGAAVQVAR